MRVFLLLLFMPSISVLAAVKVVNSCYSSPLLQQRRAPWTTIRGGDDSSSDERDRKELLLKSTPQVHVVIADDDDASDETLSSSSPKKVDDDSNDSNTHTSSEDDNNAAAVLGIKAHNKKSNAVGDPDSDSDDDDENSDNDDDTEEEWQDLEDFLEQPHQVQVQVELVQPEQQQQQQPTSSSSGGGGGGGVKQMMGGGVGRRAAATPRGKRSLFKSTTTTPSVSMAEAWYPYIYMPPSAEALETLYQQARTVDAFGKTRLDRRTLYAGLLLEWAHNSRGAADAQRRRFLNPQTSQQLQAALSLATQPQWRQAAPQSSGISLSQGGTLSMQETIAMALAHSLGCGMVILDDDILSKVKSHLKEDVKPAVLLESLLSMAKNKQLVPSGSSGSIASLLKHDVASGLEDPFDERATFSRDEMTKWEKEWTTTNVHQEGPLPLVLFVRTKASPNLLKSKSAVEYLQQECTSSDSIHLLVLGKGMDHHLHRKKTTTTSSSLQDNELFSHQQQQHQQQSMDGGGAPWFGFSPQNQNASGQNDPEGSRRFNIFLARTFNAHGTPGVIGAIAPPQAGNLFPHIMAMQARERMMMQDSSEADDESSFNPVRAELERWAQLLQQQDPLGGTSSSPPPQFFNASLAASYSNSAATTPSPQVLQEALQQAMTELLDRLAAAAQTASTEEHSPEIDEMFARVLQNEHLRRGIAENLARAAPALSDPKCQGVMLSIYVPPPPTDSSLSGNNSNKPGWFQKMLNHHETTADEDASTGDEDNDQQQQQQTRRRRQADTKTSKTGNNDKAEGNLAKLETYCRPIILETPSDPVRLKSWEAWIAREVGAATFLQNRKALHDELRLRHLSLEQHTGTRGAGSALRQMLSFRDITDDMENVIKCAVELEAAKSRRHHESDVEALEKDLSLDVDLSLSQLLLTEDGRVEEPAKSIAMERSKKKTKSDVKLLHPSSLETALSLVCRISPSPSGSLSLSSKPASHRSREDISALAQDKHERALVSQVVSPQDIGVTYDMIGGLSDVKELLRQSITYPLKFPHLYSEGIAREAVKGVLLFGPPGTGKTMLAKAVATEGGASFLSVDASSVENKWLGESEKNAKAVFTLARRLAPCVIFIDEVDSLLSSREGSSDDSAHGTLTSVKTTMMAEWDGLNSGTNGLGEAGSDRVVVIGSTNRPFDLDEAVLRRFPRRILVDLPDMETRKEILEVTLAENRVDPSVNLTLIAERLEGYTGSDIKEVCREAVVQISHEQAQLLDRGGLSSMNEDVTQGMLQRLRPVTMEDFDKALSKLKRSVSEKGRELARVWEWNDEYGEIKKENKNHLPQLMNMYL